MSITLYLLRHTLSAPDATIDEADWPLNANGITQAETLVPILRKLQITKIYSSPYKRAIQTVTPFGSTTGMKIAIDNRLREKKLTDQWLDDHTAAIKKSWSNFNFSFDDGETNAACQQRVVDCIKEITNCNPHQTVLISSHGNAIGLYLNSIDRDFNFEHWREMQWPDLYRIIGKKWNKISLSGVPYLSEVPRKFT